MQLHQRVWVAAIAGILAVVAGTATPASPVAAAGSSFDALGVSIPQCAGSDGRLKAKFTTDGTEAVFTNDVGAHNIGSFLPAGTHVYDVQYVLNTALPAGTIVTRTINFGTWALPTLYGSKTISFNCSTGAITSVTNLDGTMDRLTSVGELAFLLPPTTLLPSGVQGYLVEANTTFGDGGASFFTGTATDPFGRSFPVDCLPINGNVGGGTVFPLGLSLTRIECGEHSAPWGAAGLVYSDTPVAVLVVDTTPPWVNTQVPDWTISYWVNGSTPGYRKVASPPSDTVLTFHVSAWDTNDGAVNATCAPPSGSTFPIGTTTVTCTAVDRAGNIGSSIFTVTVFIDVTPPVITLPTDGGEIFVEATGADGAASFDGTLWSGASGIGASALDDVDGLVPLVCTPSIGSAFPLGQSTQPVVCSATDAHGNRSTRTSVRPLGNFRKAPTIFVQDTTPPAIAPQADITVAATSHSGAVVSYAAPATTDVVDGPGVADCAPASGSTFAIGTTVVVCTATDAHGNQATSQFAVIVLSPQQQMAALVASIGQLGLDAGTASSLTAKIQSAMKSSAPASCNQLNSLLNEVRAQTGKKLTVQQAADLTAAVTVIRSAAGCS